MCIFMPSYLQTPTLLVDWPQTYRRITMKLRDILTTLGKFTTGVATGLTIESWLKIYFQ